ncbi:MAG: hypothetical protein P4L92_17895 [Rudaea sp.]|nr:hypothetical protein [Rudaea sp.]
MPSEFLDISTKAKELKITEAVLRARILSAQLPCFAFLAQEQAFGTQSEFLPAWDGRTFPDIYWQDHGTSFFAERVPRMPRYTLQGWVELETTLVSKILSLGPQPLDRQWVGICDGNDNLICEVVAQGGPGSEYEGYLYQPSATVIGPEHVFLKSSTESEKQQIHPRAENGYLRVIAAMRALLLSPDGGDFKKQDALIELLVSRYGAAEGISRRNLESLFPRAVNVAGTSLRPPEE